MYDRVGELLSESMRSGAVDGAVEFTEEMIGNLEQAAEHPDMTEDLADVLLTSKVEVEYEVKSGVSVKD